MNLFCLLSVYRVIYGVGFFSRIVPRLHSKVSLILTHHLLTYHIIHNRFAEIEIYENLTEIIWKYHEIKMKKQRNCATIFLAKTYVARSILIDCSSAFYLL